MRLFSASLALAFLVPATGCRDAIVDPLPDAPVPVQPGPTPDPVEGAVAVFYLKGPSTLRAGSTARYRSESNPLAVRYAWSIIGPAQAGDPGLRLTSIAGTRPGPAQLRVTHYDEEGRVVGLARKTIEIVD